jgi:hypothetical protein
MVEQRSTITDHSGRHGSMVCHICSVAKGVITGAPAYRRTGNGLPPG